MSKRARKEQTWYKLVWAEDEKDAQQQGLAYVLNKILPDTMEEWSTAAYEVVPRGLIRDGKRHFDVHIRFLRVKNEEPEDEGKPMVIEAKQQVTEPKKPRYVEDVEPRWQTETWTAIL